MPFCPECGTPVNAQNNFCPNCGNKLEPIQQRGGQNVSGMNVQASPGSQPSIIVTPIQPPQQVTTQPFTQVQAPPKVEQVKTIIPNLMVYKGLGRYDTFNLVVTDRRSIFSKLSMEMMSKTISARRAKAGEEGKGFFGKWKAQMQNMGSYIDYYQGMSPDQVLADAKENYFIDNSQIRGLNVRDETGDEDMMNMYGVEIITTSKKFSFKARYDPTEAFNRLMV
jgi:hypothetical protein